MNEAKEGDLVRVTRAHTDSAGRVAVDRLIGKVASVRKYGGHLRYVVKLPNGSKLDLDARTISQLDIVTSIALLDPAFKALIEEPEKWT